MLASVSGTADALGPCPNDAGIVTVTSGANGLAAWSTFTDSGSVVGNDSVAGDATINGIVIPLGASMAAPRNGGTPDSFSNAGKPNERRGEAHVRDILSGGAGHRMLS